MLNIEKSRLPIVSPRTPLLAPEQYFESHGFEWRPALVSVGAAIVGVTMAMVGFGLILQNRLRNTGYGAEAGDVMTLVGGRVFVVAITLVLGWVFVAVLLTLGGRMTLSHEGRFRECLVLAGWGMAPTVITSIVAFAAVTLALTGASLESPEAFINEFEAALATTRALPFLVSFLVAGWQTYFYGKGLATAFSVRPGRSYLVGGVIAYGGWLLGLL